MNQGEFFSIKGEIEMSGSQMDLFSTPKWEIEMASSMGISVGRLRLDAHFAEVFSRVVARRPQLRLLFNSRCRKAYPTVEAEISAMRERNQPLADAFAGIGESYLWRQMAEGWEAEIRANGALGNEATK